MAFNKKIQPANLLPAYNNVISVVQSDNIYQERFQYIFDVKDATGKRLSRIKLPADPNGFGVFDAQRILESQVQADVFPNLAGWTAATKSFAEYYIEYGEEYTSFWTFNDNYFSSGNVGFSSTTMHSFQVGQEIYIEQNPTGATNPEYNGVHNVIQVPDAYHIVIDQSFLLGTPAEAGTAVKSDFSKTSFSAITATARNFVMNGAVNHLDFRAFNADNYILNSATTKSLLTTMPNGWNIDKSTQAYMMGYQTGGTNMKYLRVILSNGNSYRISNGNPYTKALAIGIGSWNINQALGNVIDDTITSYSAYTESITSARTSIDIVFNVQHNCTRYEQVEIIAMDRLGSFVGFNFDLKSTSKLDIKRDERNALVGSYNSTSNKWGYNTQDRTRIINNIDVIKSYTINSDFISESMVEYLSELYSSPEVYWVTSEGWLPIIVKDSSFDYKNTVNDKLISYSMNFELAFRDQVQRG